MDGNTKTASSIRQIPISDKLVSLLKEYKAYMAEILEANGIKESEYVFPSLVGTAKEPSNFDRKFKSYIEEAGLQKINLHSLRHTFATRALENGVNPRIVQEQLGHKSIKTTLGIYSHVLLPVHRDAINQIDDVFDK